MELIIIDKERFIKDFTLKDHKNGFYATPKEILERAFKELKECLNENKIPLVLLPAYKDWGFVIFDFVSKKRETYIYEYNGSAS